MAGCGSQMGMYEPIGANEILMRGQSHPLKMILPESGVITEDCRGVR